MLRRTSLSQGRGAISIRGGAVGRQPHLLDGIFGQGGVVQQMGREPVQPPRVNQQLFNIS
jgi:hypothetical protein